MTDRRQELERVTRERDDVRDTVQQLKGQLESAKGTLSQVEDECRQRKVDPEKLGAAIEQLEQRYDQAIEQADEEIQAANDALAPYIGEDA